MRKRIYFQPELGEKGTYVKKDGTLGLGFKLPNGKVVKSCGCGWYEEVDIKKFFPDNGKRYREFVRKCYWEFVSKLISF